MDALTGVTSIFSAVTGLIASLAVYVMIAIALYRMADKLGIPNGWLAFVPIANVWMLGKIADADEITPKHAKRLLITEIVTDLLAFSVAALSFSVSSNGADVSGGAAAMLLFFSFLLIAAAIVNAVFLYIAYYRICENFAPNNTTGYFLGILLGGMCCSGLIPPILLLVLSGNEPVSNVPKVTYTEVSPSDNIFR